MSEQEMYMNKSTLNKESNESASEPKLLGLPRPLVGALIGILAFLLLFSVAWFTESIYLTYALLFPYYMITLLFSRFVFSLSSYEDMVFLFLTSGIAPAIIGSLIISKKKKNRANGITLLGIYLLTSIALGFFVLMLASLFN